VIRVGTSGYSYPDWKGPFYPQSLPAAQLLAFYSQHFSACEINATYYRPPTAPQLARMLERSGGRVVFSVKLPRELTHEGPAVTTESLGAFQAAVAPLVAADRLGAVLAQFPASFRPGTESWRYLDRLLSGLRPLPTVVELRHGSWVGEATFERLRAAGVGFCAVDEPDLPGLLPPVAVVTASPGYVRFHGRNREQWHRHEAAHERYTWDYSDAELREWVPRIRRMETRTPNVFVFFNNHFQAKAVTAARRLRELLDLAAPAGPGDSGPTGASA
jgi:uncharacterized protein YecE (DUF72 family)